MSDKKSYCEFDKPDCLQCPYKDCIASVKDIKRQEAIANREYMQQRNQKILDLWNSGMSQKSIGERLSMNEFSVSHVISTARRNGKEVR